MEPHDPDGEQSDGPKFYESAEIIARGKQNPHGDGGRREGIDNDENRQSLGAEREYMGYGGSLRCPLASPNREQNQDESGDGGFQNFPRTDTAEINSHAHRDRNRHGDGKGSPRAILQRIDDD